MNSRFLYFITFLVIPILHYSLGDLVLHVALAASFRLGLVPGFHLTYICHWQAMADAVCHAAVECFA